MTETKKKKGIIRWEAIIPVVVIVSITWAYFFLFFDAHLRRGIEFVGYQVLGSQVDVAKLETSFWKASLRIQEIELTDSQAPGKNMLEIGDIRFGVLWDGLLRAKVVVNEMAVEGIKVGTPRKKPGRVKPPEPKSDKPSAVDQEVEKLKGKAAERIEKETQNNVLGDLAALLSGASGQEQLGKIEGTLASKQKLQELEKAFKEKSKSWEARLKTIPQAKEIQELSDRLKKVKTKDFKSPQELADSLKQFQEIVKEADTKYKTIQSTANDLNSDYKNLDNDLKSLDAMVKKDIQDLESRFRIPKLDAAAISKGIFFQYLDPYMAKINGYKTMAEKYIPPNALKKGSQEPEPAIQPRPRARGVTYEFGRQNSYPLFWIKKVSVSSQAGSSPDSGNIQGLITDITSNQVLIGRPTVGNLKGDFPSREIKDFGLKVSLNNMKAESRIEFDFGVGAYPVAGRPVVDSPDVKLAFLKATANMGATGTLIGLKDFNMKFRNVMQKVQYDVKAQNSTVQEILTGVFAGIPTVSIDADIAGELPNFNLNVSSNLGTELQRGFEAQVKKKIEEAKAKINAYINEQVGQQKAKLEGEIAKIKSQIDGELKKVQAQLDSQKSQAESKANESKKRSEDQAKQQLQKEGQKAVDDLKKKFGL